MKKALKHINFEKFSYYITEGKEYLNIFVLILVA